MSQQCNNCGEPANYRGFHEDNECFACDDCLGTVAHHFRLVWHKLGEAISDDPDLECILENDSIGG